MIHVGVDLHQKNSYVKTLRQVIEGCRIYHHDLEKLWLYLGQFGTEQKRVVFEATANARWMERFCHRYFAIAPRYAKASRRRVAGQAVGAWIMQFLLGQCDFFIKTSKKSSIRLDIFYKCSIIYYRRRSKAGSSVPDQGPWDEFQNERDR